jgi:4-hydroxy-3-polyprenylbenzoate decarboxylase
LDYTGDGLNAGSKVVIAAAGEPVRGLPCELPDNLRLAEGFHMQDPRVAVPGILVLRAPEYAARRDAVSRWVASLDRYDPINRFPLIVIVDDTEFAARSLDNLLWVTFTRSNPATDIGGIESFTEAKHWGCRGSLVIDARTKPHHAPPLVEDPEVTRRVDRLAAPGGPLHGVI